MISDKTFDYGYETKINPSMSSVGVNIAKDLIR